MSAKLADTSAHTFDVHRERYATEPRMRPMGAGLTLFARRKDGTEFPADILLSPLETAEGILSLAVIRDITDRKRVEDELRSLVEVTRVASEAENVAAMTTRCLTAISRYGHWQAAQAWVHDEGQDVLRCDREASYSTIEIQGFRHEILVPDRFKAVHPLEERHVILQLFDLMNNHAAPNAAFYGRRFVQAKIDAAEVAELNKDASQLVFASDPAFHVLGGSRVIDVGVLPDPR